MGETTNRTEDGQAKVYTTHRPMGMSTYFTGEGDNIVDNTIGNGPRLLWQMKSSDISKAVSVGFSENVYFKDGYIIVKNAPFGAYLDIEVVHPVAGVVGSFGRKIPLLGTGWFPLDTEDRGLVLQGLSVVMTVYNALGAVSLQDEPANFNVAGRIELFRTTTV